MKRLWALGIVFVLLLTACSASESQPSTTGSSDAAPTSSTTPDSATDDGATTTTVVDDASATSAEPPDTGDPTTTSVETTSGPDTTAATDTTVADTTVAPDDDTGGQDLPGDFPVTVETSSGPVTIEAPPVRIAALSATHVEILYDFGVGDRLVAVDINSNYPAEATTHPQIDAFNLNVEEVIALDPDLVVLTFDPGGAVEALSGLGIPTLLFDTPTTTFDAFLQISILGAAVGVDEQADELVQTMATEIDEIIAGVGDAGSGITFYHESDPFSFYTPTSASFIGQVYSAFGMVNIADAAPDAAGQTFPQLSAEYIIASDPLLIISSDPSEDISVFQEREGWGAMSAVEFGDIGFVDGDLTSRWGPRLVEFYRTVATIITEFGS